MRRLQALMLRTQRWAITEANRRNGQRRVKRLNLPGGWSTIDAFAQREGLVRGSIRCGRAWYWEWVVANLTRVDDATSRPWQK
jgi:hypothetical protein